MDFNHDLGYPPLFYIWSDLGGSSIYECPYSEISPSGVVYDGLSEISAWCDSTRVRVLYNRESVFVSGTSTEYSSSTINLYIMILAVDLTEVQNG